MSIQGEPLQVEESRLDEKAGTTGLVRIDQETRSLWTDSRAVAKVFGKLHKNVLRDIDRLECSRDFHGLNFEPTSALVKQPRGGVREERAYRMTEWGFAFLTMGFTGREAAAFKEAFIAEFRRMSELLRQPASPTEPPPIDMAGAVVLRGGRPTTSSQAVARLFGKRHGTVLRAIDGLRVRSADMMREGDPLAARFHLDNFEETRGPAGERGFMIAEAGFMALGLAGPSALRLRILFIEEFRRTRDAIARPGPQPRRRETKPPEPGQSEGAPDARARKYRGYRGSEEEWEEFGRVWRRAFGERRVRIAEIHALAEANGLFGALRSRSSTTQGSVTAFGMALKDRVGLPCGAFLVERMALSNGHSTFRLARVGAALPSRPEPALAA